MLLPPSPTPTPTRLTLNGTTLRDELDRRKRANDKKDGTLSRIAGAGKTAIKAGIGLGKVAKTGAKIGKKVDEYLDKAVETVDKVGVIGKKAEKVYDTFASLGSKRESNTPKTTTEHFITDRVPRRRSRRYRNGGDYNSKSNYCLILVLMLAINCF